MSTTNVEMLVVPVCLASGETILVEVRRTEREEDVAWGVYDLSEAVKTLASLVSCIATPLSGLSFDRLGLEIGVSLALKEGKLTSLLVSGSASSSIKVTAEWTRDKSS